MDTKFKPNIDETILYSSQPSQKWYVIAWRIGIGIFEVAAFILISFTAFASLAKVLLGSFLLPEMADVISRIIFQGLTPLLVIAWFVEDTARLFSTRLIMTDQRLWTKGSPYAWTPEKETPLKDIKGMSARRDVLFVHLKSSKKTRVYVLPDGKEIAKAFTEFINRTNPI